MMESQLCGTRSHFLSERPNFGPRQIRETPDFVVGARIYECHKGEKGISRQLMEVVAVHEDTVTLKYLDGIAKGLETKDSLIDFNIFPYTNGEWNRSNWFERVEGNLE